MPNIPVEILHEVFKQSLFSPLRAHRACEFPWYLGHVCSQWRALFFAMRSTFWSKIEIEIWTQDYYNNFQREKYFEDMQKIVVFFLDCTQGAPFSFRLCMEEEYDLKDSYGVCLILMDLIEHSVQWEEVALRLETSELGFLLGTRGRLPLLKKLEILVDTEEYRPMRCETTRSIVANVFGEAPRLTHVVICDMSPLLPFNWSSLTIIHFHDITRECPERILATLRELINLVELSFDDYIYTNRARSIHLPHLESLSVYGVELLTILETPALRRLKIELGTDSLDDAGIAISFLRRSEIKLSTLVVKDTGAATVTEILSSAPEVNDLALIHVQDIANVFKWLAGPGERKLGINSLSVIWDELITDPKHVEEGLSALHDMIAGRKSLDARSPMPREVIIQIPCMGRGAAANLKSVCRSRGIRFGFAEETPTLIWGIELPADKLHVW